MSDSRSQLEWSSSGNLAYTDYLRRLRVLTLSDLLRCVGIWDPVQTAAAGFFEAHPRQR